MPGRVEALHVAPRAGAPMESRAAIAAVADFGLEGDRCARAGSKGQVTLVSAEELAAAGEALGRAIPAGATRRNVTISGVPLSREKGARLELGSVLVEVTGDAAPCELMDSEIGAGARDALVGRSGVRARILAGGRLAVGDPVAPVAP